MSKIKTFCHLNDSNENSFTGLQIWTGKKYGVDPNRPKTRSRLKCITREREGFSSKYYARHPVPYTHTNEVAFPSPTVSATRTKNIRSTRKKGCFPWWFSVLRQRAFSSPTQPAVFSLRETSFTLFPLSFSFAFKQKIMFPLSMWTL